MSRSERGQPAGPFCPALATGWRGPYYCIGTVVRSFFNPPPGIPEWHKPMDHFRLAALSFDFKYHQGYIVSLWRFSGKRLHVTDYPIDQYLCR